MKASASHNPARSSQQPYKDRNIGAKHKVVRDEQGTKKIYESGLSNTLHKVISGVL